MGYLTRRISTLLKSNLNHWFDKVWGTRSDIDVDWENLLNEGESEQTGKNWQQKQDRRQQTQAGASTGSSLPDYYEILEVHYKASPEVIEKAYKALAIKYHPDKQPPHQRAWAEAKMKQINEAYFHLRDPEKRREYDAKRGYSSR
jgi:hypothetical protein